jgi:hypothetical protein
VRSGVNVVVVGKEESQTRAGMKIGCGCGFGCGSQNVPGDQSDGSVAALDRPLGPQVKLAWTLRATISDQ